MPDAMKLIRAELGRDAVILNSREIRTNGFLGLFRKKNIEVIAAMDEQEQAIQPKSIIEQDRIPSLLSKNIVEKETRNTKLSDVQQKGQNEKIYKELAEIKSLLSKIPESSAHTENINIPAPFKKAYERLVSQNLHQDILVQMSEKILEKYYADNMNISEYAATSFIHEELEKILNTIQYVDPLQKKIIQVIGPTGVGKTTTLAKIAAEFAFKMKKKIAFITTDTFRIGAVEQLKTYAKILNVPVSVCYNSKDVKDAIKEFEDYDHIFIDTAGRNYKISQYVEEIKNTTNIDEELDTLLVFSLTSKESDLDEIYKNFSTMKINKFIFTKMDETNQWGSIINLPYKYKTPIIYLTNGQNVPDDLIQVNSKDIVNIVLGELNDD